MNVPQTVAEVLRDHVTLETESIDWMYLNVYVPQLQSVGGVVGYLHAHHGQRFASTTAVVPMTEAFVAAVDRFAAQHGVDAVGVTHQQFDPTARAIAKDVGRAIEGVTPEARLDQDQQPIDAAAQIDRLDCQPPTRRRGHQRSPESTCASHAGSASDGIVRSTPLGSRNTSPTGS